MALLLVTTNHNNKSIVRTTDKTNEYLHNGDIKISICHTSKCAMFTNLKLYSYL